MITNEQIKRILELYEDLRSVRKVGEALGIGKDTVHRIIRKHRLTSRSPDEFDEQKGDHRVVQVSGIRTLEGLMEAANINPAEWAVESHRINKWDALAGRGEIIECYSIRANLVRRPEFWFSKVECKPLPIKPKRKTGGAKVCLVIPDIQAGYRRTFSGKLEPLHDVRAVDVAVQVAAFLESQPDGVDSIICVGDNLDLAAWGSYSTDPALLWCTQPALVYLHHFFAQLRLACPSASIYYQMGNHEARIQRVLNDTAHGEGRHLRPADKLDGPSVLSVANLLSLDALGVEYVEPYGAPLWWEGVRFHHGHLVRSKGGQTVTAMLNQGFNHSQVVGHIHRREIASRTVPTAKGHKIISAMSPGCLCRLDPAVPSSPGRGQNDWQHGLGLLYSHGGSVSMQLIPINDASAVVHGQRFEGQDRTEELKAATGLPF
tara:strand:- start:1018 stop:2313 length:1296 start_codon:yes stop_codon:yes gene_type:complete